MMNQEQETQKWPTKLARGASPSQVDCMLSASVYNADQSIPKPPKTKPVHLGSLNFSTLRSNDSKTSRTKDQSFKLPRLQLDDSLNRSIEKQMKKESEKKKRYSPYRSSSQSATKEVAVGIVNDASATSTTALKLR